MSKQLPAAAIGFVIPLLTAASLMCLPASAQTAVPGAAPGAATVFTTESFAQYSPRTAFDLVERVPGFSVDEGDDGARGFGQASGNVLIDGQRVSGKSNTARDALTRLPVSRVLRLELVDGATLGIPGLSGQVVNVITQGTAANSGSWEWSAKFRENLPPAYNQGKISYSGGKSALTWTLAAESEPERGANRGPTTVTDGAGGLIATLDEDFNFTAEFANLSGTLAWKAASGVVANLNAKAGIFEPNIKAVAKLFPVGGAEGRRLFQRAEDEWNAELGGDIAFDAGPGRLKLIGLARREDSAFTNRVRGGDIDGTDLFGSQFDQRINEGEYIARGEYSFSHANGNSWQLSAENAFNFLEGDAQLFTSSNGGPLVQQTLALTDSRVEEQRQEIALTHARKLSPKFDLQVSIGAEQSELSQSGDAENVRRFMRPKGFVNLTWKPDSTLTLNARIEREVEQLDFFDFISSVDIDNDNANSGNPEIVPPQNWVATLKAEKNLGEWGAVTIETFAATVEDLVDTIPIGTGEGPGNIDEAYRYGASMNATLKLTPLGFTGAELSVEAEAAKSNVKDPFTGRDRRFNFDTVSYVEMRLRQDIPNTDIAWGGRAEFYRDAGFFGRDERNQESKNTGYVGAFIQHKDLFGLKAALRVGNLLGQHDKFRRELYAPDRNGALVRVESEDRTFGPVFVFALSGNF
jgi:hypothetical protein